MSIDTSQNWYVLQVISRREKKIIELIKKLDLIHFAPYLPEKKLKIKKLGITKDQVFPLYPGYIFIIGDWDVNKAKEIIKIPGTIKFVGGLNSPGILQKEEKEVIFKITKHGLAGYSKVINEGRKIKIISGPLKELEGVIDTVDRRKQKAIVKLPLLNSVVKVSLGFEYLRESENMR